MFIAIDGPNGVGKSTIATLLAKRLGARGGTPVHLTTEPSRTPLGQLLRDSESTLGGRAYALAIAADRVDHIESEIIPWLDDGYHVITDRYVQSSLVLQVVDGVYRSEIWSYNRYVLQPAVSFYLEDTAEVIAARLAARPSLTRLESAATPVRELRLYRQAYTFLGKRDWNQHLIDCHGLSPDEIVDQLLSKLPAD
jgi:dTMP kinase